MNNTLYQKPSVTKAIGRILALVLVAAILFGLPACGKPTPIPEEVLEIEPVTVEREAGPQALQTANEATALALRHYIYARLKIEEFIAMDFDSMPAGTFEGMLDELVSIWETADILASGAELITDEAILMLETASTSQMAAKVFPHPKALTLSLATEDRNGNDGEYWAEKLTRQYDATSGAHRLKDLAEQLGTDVKTAHALLERAMEDMHRTAEMEEAHGEGNSYTRSINILEGYKTASKVGLYVGATIATGGGSLASLAGSSMSLGTAGAVVVGGVDCIVDVGKTTSAIILGEDHQVTVDFQKASDVLSPVSTVMGLVTLDPTNVASQIAIIGEALKEWFYPGKITGMVINPIKEGGTRMVAQLIDQADQQVKGSQEGLEKELDEIGLSLPSDGNLILESLMEVYTVNSEAFLASMQELASLIGVEGWEVPAQDLELPEADLEAQEIESLNPEDVGTLTEEQQETPTGSDTVHPIAGTYSGSAALQFVAEDVEADSSLGITLQLNESGTGTASVSGFSGDAHWAGDSVTFSVSMAEGGFTVSCVGEGSIISSGNGITLSGVMSCYLMGIKAATYSWSAQ